MKVYSLRLEEWLGVGTGFVLQQRSHLTEASNQLGRSAVSAGRRRRLQAASLFRQARRSCHSSLIVLMVPSHASPAHHHMRHKVPQEARPAGVSHHTQREPGDERCENAAARDAKLSGERWVDRRQASKVQSCDACGPGQHDSACCTWLSSQGAHLKARTPWLCAMFAGSSSASVKGGSAVIAAGLHKLRLLVCYCKSQQVMSAWPSGTCRVVALTAERRPRRRPSNFSRTSTDVLSQRLSPVCRNRTNLPLAVFEVPRLMAEVVARGFVSNELIQISKRDVRICNIQ